MKPEIGIRKRGCVMIPVFSKGLDPDLDGSSKVA